MSDIKSKNFKVTHFVGMKGLGGVQKNFTDYINFSTSQKQNIQHKVYTLGKKDSNYNLDVEVFNLIKVSSLFSFIFDLISKKTILHFYNNLSSLKVSILLAFIPSHNLIMHERGTAWNQPTKLGFITRFNAKKAKIIIVNSKATKTLLIKKFAIPERKITIIYNGINCFVEKSVLDTKYNKSKVFKVGFIGRLDSPKGVHVLIDAVKLLENDKIELVIAGDGPLLETLKLQSNICPNVKFLGRINNLKFFFDQIDLLVVPSIREPFGNVCLEAGINKVAVIASNVDGIPEIIKNNFSGELINPTDELDFSISSKAAPIPEYVINPQTFVLQKPMQINASLLAQKILDLSKNHKRRYELASNLHKNVIENFSMQRYCNELNDIYQFVAENQKKI